MLGLPVIKRGSLANTGAMSVVRMGARLLLSVSLTQFAITAPLVMAQLTYTPLSSPPAVTGGGEGGSTNVGAIVGGVLVGVFFTILVNLAVLWYCLRKKRERAGRANGEKAALPTTAQAPPRTRPALDDLLYPSARSQRSSRFEPGS